jgi:hypothetical protein
MLVGTAALSVCMTVTHTLAYDVESYSPSVYDPDSAVMDGSLGISGSLIEDFEDDSFLPDLEVSLIGTNDPGQLRDSTAQPWDGVQGYSNAISDTGDDGYDFHIMVAGGTNCFGIGFAHASDGITVRVNGVDIVQNIFDLPGFTIDGVNRNGYLIIRRGPSDAPITVVELISQAPDSNDFIQIDHIAIQDHASPPVHYWPLDWGNSDDMIGGQLGTVVGTADWIDTSHGGGFAFDGTTYIETDYIPQLGTDDSLSFVIWIRLTEGYPTTPGELLGLQQAGGHEMRVLLNVNTNEILALFRDDNYIASSASAPLDLLDDTRWHQIVAIRDGVSDRVQLYVDGVLEDDQPSNTGAINMSSSQTLAIGADNHNSGYVLKLKGEMDGLRVYDYALTLEDVRRLYPNWCKADFNWDDEGNSLDFVAFLNAFVAGCP